MKELAAYLLLVAGGNVAPSADDVKTALSSVGIDASDEALSALLPTLAGKDLEELMAMGADKLASGGGGGAVAAAPAGGAGGADAGAAAEEEAPAEKEEPEEVDLGGGMDMFGGGDDCKLKLTSAAGGEGGCKLGGRARGKAERARSRSCARVAREAGHRHGSLRGGRAMCCAGPAIGDPEQRALAAEPLTVASG